MIDKEKEAFIEDFQNKGNFTEYEATSRTY